MGIVDVLNLSQRASLVLVWIDLTFGLLIQSCKELGIRGTHPNWWQLKPGGAGPPAHPSSGPSLSVTAATSGNQQCQRLISDPSATAECSVTCFSASSQHLASPQIKIARCFHDRESVQTTKNTKTDLEGTTTSRMRKTHSIYSRPAKSHLLFCQA